MSIWSYLGARDKEINKMQFLLPDEVKGRGREIKICANVPQECVNKRYV